MPRPMRIHIPRSSPKNQFWGLSQWASWQWTSMALCASSCDWTVCSCNWPWRLRMSWPRGELNALCRSCWTSSQRGAIEGDKGATHGAIFRVTAERAAAPEGLLLFPKPRDTLLPAHQGVGGFPDPLWSEWLIQRLHFVDNYSYDGLFK